MISKKSFTRPAGKPWTSVDDKYKRIIEEPNNVKLTTCQAVPCITEDTINITRAATLKTAPIP